MPGFSFLTNPGKTLLLIANDSRIRTRDIARLLPLTERAAQRIVADLARRGYIEREREGRRNLYNVRTHLPPSGCRPERDIRHRDSGRHTAHPRRPAPDAPPDDVYGNGGMTPRGRAVARRNPTRPRPGPSRAAGSGHRRLTRGPHRSRAREKAPQTRARALTRVERFGPATQWARSRSMRAQPGRLRASRVPGEQSGAGNERSRVQLWSNPPRSRGAPT